MTAPTVEEVAQELTRAGYSRLFEAGDRSSAADVWRAGESRRALEAIVQDETADDLARLLASEVLYRFADGYPPEGWNGTLARVYASALALTGTGDRPVALTGNAWGFLSYDEERGARGAGPLGEHLLAVGEAAVPQLVPLLDDAAPILYEGSRDATSAGRLGFRVKDAAAYFVSQLTGDPLPHHDDAAARDAAIDRLKERLGHG